MEKKEIDNFEKQQYYTWYATTLCSRCKKQFLAPSIAPDISNEVLCNGCESDVDIF